MTRASQNVGELAQFESRLQREITNMRYISHPNIVSLIEYFSVQPSNGRPRSGMSEQLNRTAYASDAEFHAAEMLRSQTAASAYAGV